MALINGYRPLASARAPAAAKPPASPRRFATRSTRTPDLLDKDPAVRAFIAMKEMTRSSNILHLLEHYDVSLDRACFGAINELKAVQKERIGNEPRPTNSSDAGHAHFTGVFPG
jgi:hypothetical protein